MSSDTTSRGIVEVLKATFARHGVPDQVMTDNGPQFASRQFAEFMKTCGISHITSSSHFSSSNGAAERTVQTAKKILSQQDPWLGLLAYRSTPLKATGYSPSQLLMGRRLKTTVPFLPSTLKPKWPASKEVKRRDASAKQDCARQYDRRHGVRPLDPLTEGQQVLIRTDEEQRWRRSGTVVQPASAPRSYMVETDNGNTVRRNRRHLAAMPPSAVPPAVAHTTPTVATPESSPRLRRDSRSPQMTRSGCFVRPPRRLIAE